MPINITKSFIKAFIFFMILFFSINLSYDTYKTFYPEISKDNIHEFSYDFFKEPFKYVYFKRITEIDKKYFEDTVKRIKNHTSQLKLF